MTSDLRRRALDAIDDLGGGTATGPAVLRRMRERSVAGGRGTGDSPPQADEPCLYPALHRLEADWVIASAWRVGPDGRVHRTYRTRRLLSNLRRQIGSD